MISVSFKNDVSIAKSFRPIMKATASTIRTNGKQLKKELILNAPLDSGRMIRSTDGHDITKGDVYAYSVNINTVREGGKINYAWFFVEGAALPRVEIGKLAVIKKSDLSTKEKQYPVIASQLDSSSDAVFFRRVTGRYRRNPYIRSVAINIANRQRRTVPEAIMKDMYRKGR